MRADSLVAVLASPIGLFASLAVGLVSVLAWLGLRRRWARPGYARSARALEASVLLVTVAAVFLMVLIVGAMLQERDFRAAMQRDLAARSTQSTALRAQIDAEIDAARRLLADRAVEKISQEKLAEARAELVRFVPFQDPRILQMIALIDQELAIRASVK